MKKQTEITILQLNDSQAYLEPHQEMFWEGGDKVWRRQCPLPLKWIFHSVFFDRKNNIA